MRAKILDETVEEQPAAGELSQEEIEADRSGDDFSRRPYYIPAPVWKQVKQLHRLLGHPSNATLVKLLQRWKASEEAILGQQSSWSAALAARQRPR